MSIPPEQIEALKRHCDSVAALAEGGVTYLLLAGLRLPRGASPAVLDALLRIGDRGDGYANRLFLSERAAPASGLGLNWNALGTRILERNWNAYSWKAPADLTLEEILLEHLKALP